ncbi:MAG: hypothetical protein WBC40_06180 [Halobacteriota archaeon]
MMSEKIVVGLLRFTDYAKKKDLNLTKIYDEIVKKGKWKPIRLIENLDILFSIKDDKTIRIRRDGSLFYYKKFLGQYFSPEDLKSMWDEFQKIMNGLNLDVVYENEIGISIHAESPGKTYEENKSSIDEFFQKLLRNFSVSEISDKESTFVTITPDPEAIPL